MKRFPQICAIVLGAAVMPAAFLSSAAAEPPRPVRILAWVESSNASAGVGSRLRRMVGRFTDSVIRATSPDIAREQRRLWIITPVARSKCLLSTEIGVHEPRWGRGGYILFLAESDTNGDGLIDFNDEYAVKILPERGGPAREIGRGRSAAWSPDGQLVAILSGRGLTVVNMIGHAAKPSARGRLILTDSGPPELATSVWAVQAQSGAIEAIEPALTRRLQWLGGLAPDGETVVYPSTQRTDLFIAPRGDQAAGQNITNDAHLDLDPSWSPDQQQIVYVSTNPSGTPSCH